MTRLVWKASLVVMATMFSRACCAVKYHWRGSLAPGFWPFDHSYAALPRVVRESMTQMVFGPHSEGMEPSDHLVRSLEVSTKALGVTRGLPAGPDW